MTNPRQLFVRPNRIARIYRGIISMAPGIIWVASEIGGIPEFVVDGYNGLLVRPGDSGSLAAALTSLLADPDTRKSFAEAAFTAANTLDWRLIADRYAQIYHEALEAAK